jgi:GT2 family glycosyltransferase
MRVSFVIPIYNHWQLINTLLADIMRYCTPDEVIVVNDCSNDVETLNGLTWWEVNYSIKTLRPLENLGFLKASNYGISKATGDAICLISSDVRIETDLAKVVRETLTLNPETLIGGVLYSHDTGWNQFNGRVFSYLEGWLLCCTKSAWEDLGGFDERFCPSDMEDVDLSTTAREKGYALIPLNSSKIRHLGGQTIGYTDERMAMTVKHKEIFRQKWMTQ